MPAALKARKQSRPTMTHLEPAEILSVLRAAKAKGVREWAMSRGKSSYQACRTPAPSQKQGKSFPIDYQ
jgi:hypothetical protein